MKRERLSMMVLVIEIAAIVYLHSIKNHQSIADGKVAGNGKKAPAAAVQLNAMHISKLK